MSTEAVARLCASSERAIAATMRSTCRGLFPFLHVERERDGWECALYLYMVSHGGLPAGGDGQYVLIYE